MTYIVIFVFLALFLFDLPALLRERDWRALGVYAAMSVVAFIYVLRFARGEEVWSPIKAMSLFFEQTLGLNYEMWQGHS